MQCCRGEKFNTQFKLQVVVYGMKLPTGFQLIGQVGLKDYESWLSYLTSQAKKESKDPITKRAYAR